MFKKNKMWTKKEIKRLIDLWENVTIEQLSKEFNRKPMAIRSMAVRIRKEGYKLTRKQKVGTISLLIKEALGELKQI